MRISFDWLKIYGALVSQSSRPAKSAFAAARQIENDIFEEGWPAGELFGDQMALMHRYGFSRATLREAVRLLEDRHVARMRRGPGGGLIILPVSRAAIAPAVADYFHAIGTGAEQLRQARTVLEIVAAYRQSFAEGAEAVRAFNNEFRHRLATRGGAGLLVASSWMRGAAARSAGDHAVIDLFSACLDAIEDRSRAQAELAVSSLSGAQPALTQARAHALARQLTLELHQVRVTGSSRIGTEDQLCERHHVSREVLRQAIRVLESHGLIDCQRGRTHGLHAGVSDAAALVELIVAYLSSIRFSWDELEAVARIVSRTVRTVVAAESTPLQRQELLRRLERFHDWSDSPSLVTAQLHSEWAIVANPILIFMEQCVTAYCARSSAALWPGFDDAELPPTQQLQLYMAAAARGDLVRADRLVDDVCARIGALRHRSASGVGVEERVFLA